MQEAAVNSTIREIHYLEPSSRGIFEAFEDEIVQGKLIIEDSNGVPIENPFVPQTNVQTFYGVFSLDADGTYRFETFENDPNTQFLPSSEFIAIDRKVNFSDGTSANLEIHLHGVDDPTLITSNGGGDTATISIAENTTEPVTRVTALDVDADGPQVQFKLSGADAALFKLVNFDVDEYRYSSSDLMFIGAPDHEKPLDANHDNVYEVTLTAYDGVVENDSQTIKITVFDVKEDGEPSVNLPTDGPDYLMGTAGNDVLDGHDGNDLIVGGAGNDTLRGSGGDDFLDGGMGNDQLGGGFGNDFLQGGIGKDQLWGNDGNDVLRGGEDNDSLFGQTGNDVLYGDAGNDSLAGQEGDDILFGGDGNDAINGGSGTDILSGDAGNDQLDGQGGNDELRGGSGSDQLRGGVGTDVLDGGTDNDTLFGGANADQLTGGLGNDAFVFDTVLGKGNIDTITDFSNALGNDDVIQLENAVFTVLTQTGALSASAFAANTAGAASDADDRIIYETDTGKLFYDADGSGKGAAVQFATLTGHPTLTAADFFVI